MYTYFLVDPNAKDAVLIDPVLDQVCKNISKAAVLQLIVCKYNYSHGSTKNKQQGVFKHALTGLDG